MATRSQREKREKTTVSARRRVTEHQDGVSLSSVNVPDGAQLFAIKAAGTYRIDIIPYKVGKGNPFAKEGELHYERTYFVHRGVGPDNGTFVCSSRTFKKPCYICEWRAKEARNPEGDEQAIKNLKPKERQLFNVIVRDNKRTDEEPVILLWEMSHFLFGKALDAKVRAGDDGEYDLFADLEQGLTLRVTFEEEKSDGYKFFKVSDIEFKPRKEPLDESLADQAYNLDLVPKEIGYKELKDVFLMTGGAEEEDEDEDDEEAPAPKKKGAKKPEPEEEEEPEDEDEEPEDDEDEGFTKASAKGIKVGTMVEHDEHGTCKVVHVSGDETSLRIEDEDGETHRAIGVDAVEVVKGKKAPPAATKPAPAKKPGKKTPEPEPEEDEEESDDEDLEDPEPEEEEEEPAPKKKGRPAKTEKPAPAAGKKPPAGKKKPAEDEDDDLWE